MAEGGIRSFTDGVAIITGGASGIGAALARALAARGAVVVLADRQHDEAGALALELSQAGARVEAAEVDVRDAAGVEALVAGVTARHGRLDYIFNNAGTGVGGEVKDYDLDDWRYIVEVNLMGVIHGIHAAYPRMVRQGFGHIVNTASMAGWMATPLTTSYCATKHAVVGLSRSLRIEARAHGVRVSALCPGVIRTPILVNAGRFGRTKFAVPVPAQIAQFERFRPMDSNRFAARALGHVARNKSIIVAPRWWYALLWLNRLSPALADRIGQAIYAQMRRALGA